MKLLWELFIVFLKVGTFTFGGGFAMLPLIQSEIVKEKKWMTEEEMIDCLALSQSLPGMIAVNTAIYIGYKKKGLAGSFVSSLGAILPAFVSILIILLFLSSIDDNQYVNGALEGIKAASVALIAMAAFTIGRQVIKGKIGIFIAAVSFILIVFAGINAIWAIVFGGLAGLAFFWCRRKKRKTK
ncbi:MAG: chromate transporter [Eubacteriales bacterium]|nr:chromate transporter [Eubacteriales bacterium]